MENKKEIKIIELFNEFVDTNDELNNLLKQTKGFYDTDKSRIHHKIELFEHLVNLYDFFKINEMPGLIEYFEIENNNNRGFIKMDVLLNDFKGIIDTHFVNITYGAKNNDELLNIINTVGIRAYKGMDE